MKSIAISLVLVLSSTVFAECQSLSEYLSNNFPLRTLVERFGQEYTYAVLEQDKNNAKLSVITCIGESYSIKSQIQFHTSWVDRLRYDFEQKRLYVVFKDETEQYGWIYKNGDSYNFEYFSDPEL